MDKALTKDCERRRFIKKMQALCQAVQTDQRPPKLPGAIKTRFCMKNKGRSYIFVARFGL